MHEPSARRVLWPLALTVALLATLGASARETDNWPSFRGPAALAVADDDPRLPDTWSTTENVAWKTPIEGLGWSSPVVWGNRVFLTTVISDGPVEEPRMGLYFPYGSPDSGGMPTKEGDLRKREKDVHHWLVYAVDFDSGAVAWKTEVNAEPPKFDRHLKNTYASETPVTDGERVYAYFGNVGVFALDLSGKKVWERSASIRSATRLGWGTAASPMLARRQALRRQRQRGAVLRHGARRGDRQRAVAGRPRRGHQLGHAVRLAQREAHRAGHRRHPPGALLRPRRQGAVAASTA